MNIKIQNMLEATAQFLLGVDESKKEDEFTGKLVTQFIKDMNSILEAGSIKHGDKDGILNYTILDNRGVEGRKGSMKRHSIKANSGITSDPEHGYSHYAAVATNAMILYFHEQKKLREKEEL